MDVGAWIGDEFDNGLALSQDRGSSQAEIARGEHPVRAANAGGAIGELMLGEEVTVLSGLGSGDNNLEAYDVGTQRNLQGSEEREGWF